MPATNQFSYTYTKQNQSELNKRFPLWRSNYAIRTAPKHDLDQSPADVKNVHLGLSNSIDK